MASKTQEAPPEPTPPDVVELDKMPAPDKGEPDMRPGNWGVPSKSLLEEHPQTHPGALSPGQYAQVVAGKPPDAPVDSEEMAEYARKYSEAERRRRFG